MKKISFLLLVALILVGCKTNAQENEVKDYKTEIERVDLKYKTIEEEDSELTEGEKKTKSEGKDGYKKVVYRVNEDGSKEYLNEWTYEEPVNEVISVGTKKDETVVDNSETSNTGNNNTSNGGTPNTGGNNGNGGSNGGTPNTGGNGNSGGNVTPPTPEPKPDPKPPVNVCNIYEGNDGNGWWSSYDKANDWAYNQMHNENSPWFMYAYAVGNSEKGCGWFIYFY